MSGFDMGDSKALRDIRELLAGFEDGVCHPTRDQLVAMFTATIAHMRSPISSFARLIVEDAAALADAVLVERERRGGK